MYLPKLATCSNSAVVPPVLFIKARKSNSYNSISNTYAFVISDLIYVRIHFVIEGIKYNRRSDFAHTSKSNRGNFNQKGIE